ncbi:hypothetical protein QBC40DRAFT_250339 [Triangularia verruculosa]|uniref:Uncharacterized protein n=1 Tax=Triangularia verruculosa TaxID=2587418 RepID=A0AAN6XP36_9PEZI|nr:hypothetical protein QBC40DRAFT_250339 [Triangularia verruculosa]
MAVFLDNVQMNSASRQIDYKEMSLLTLTAAPAQIGCDGFTGAGSSYFEVVNSTTGGHPMPLSFDVPPEVRGTRSLIARFPAHYTILDSNVKAGKNQSSISVYPAHSGPGGLYRGPKVGSVKFPSELPDQKTKAAYKSTIVQFACNGTQVFLFGLDDTGKVSFNPDPGRRAVYRASLLSNKSSETEKGAVIKGIRDQIRGCVSLDFFLPGSLLDTSSFRRRSTSILAGHNKDIDCTQAW